MVTIQTNALSSFSRRIAVQTVRDMAGRHRARSESIQIIKVEEIASSQCTKVDIKQFHNSDIRFPQKFRYARNLNKPRFTSKVSCLVRLIGSKRNFITPATNLDSSLPLSHQQRPNFRVI